MSYGPTAVDLELYKEDLRLRADDLDSDTIDRLTVLIAAVEAERESVRREELKRDYYKNRVKVLHHRIVNSRERAEAVDARAVELMGVLRATANMLETLRKERSQSKLVIFHDDRDRITQAVLKRAHTTLNFTTEDTSK